MPLPAYAVLPAQPTFHRLTLRALRELGGHAERHAIRRRAVELGAFSAAQLAIPASPSKRRQYASMIDYRLSWALRS
jgi:hypothetical protein